MIKKLHIDHKSGTNRLEKLSKIDRRQLFSTKMPQNIKTGLLRPPDGRHTKMPENRFCPRDR